MANAQTALQQGRTFQQAGRRAEARRCYEQALQVETADHGAWFSLGTLELIENRPASAVPSLQRALTLRPSFPEAHFYLGLALQMQGQFAAAAEAYRAAVTQRPDYLEAIGNLAMALQAQGKLSEAIAAYRRVLELRPNFAEVHCNLGNALHAQGDLAAAIASYREALRLKPDFAEVHNSLGVALKAQGELDAAIASYRAALATKGNYLAALSNLAIALVEQRKWDEAITTSRQALAVNPRHSPTLLTLGRAFEGQGEWHKAADAYQQILQHEPNHAGALCNLGVILQRQGKIAEAMSVYQCALAAEPRNVEALTNLGTAFQAQNDLAAAIASYTEALSIQPHLGQTRFNLGVCQLAAGDFAQGWTNYEFRWQTEQGKFKRPFTQPLWRGNSPLSGKKILIYPEQGLGDTLQFARYIPMLAELGATVVFEVQRSLLSLLQSLPGAAVVIARGDPLPEFDVHCPLLSLPLAFATELKSIPDAVPYLRVPTEKMAQWKKRLLTTETARPRIGVVWSGGPHHKTDHLRSIPFEQFRSITRFPSARFFSLQKEVKPSDAPLLAATWDLTVLAGEIDDFADTAAIIAQLDLVIAVDTSVAHLAGALGKPTWILLPFAPDWRWMLGRSDSPWYPSVTLFRQTAPGDWEGVLKRVSIELARLFS